MGVVDKVRDLFPEGDREEVRCPDCGAELAAGQTTCEECQEAVVDPVDFVITHAELHQ